MKKIKTLKAINKLSYDYIILDLGAGTSFNTLDFFWPPATEYSSPHRNPLPLKMFTG